MTEREARAGEGLSQALTPAAEVKSAMTGFLKEFNGFQSEVKQALQHQEERLTMLDRKTMTYWPPRAVGRDGAGRPAQEGVQRLSAVGR